MFFCVSMLRYNVSGAFSSRSRSLYAIVCPSVCRLSVVCLSETIVRPTQAIKIFGNISTSLNLVRWPSVDIQVKL